MEDFTRGPEVALRHVLVHAAEGTHVLLRHCRRYGTKIPCTAKTALGVDATRPSAPPSCTCIWDIAISMRLPSRTRPGESAFAVVVSEQIAPAAPAVTVHGATNASVESVTVAASLPPPGEGALLRSVTRMPVVTSTSP